MPTDPRRLKAGELCRLLNSTPLGEVLSESQLRRQRNGAGLRIGTGPTVDLLKYTAWLVGRRHLQKSTTAPAADISNRHEAARGAAAVGGGAAGSRKQEALIAALLTEPTYSAAAARAGVGETTLYRWLNQPAFRLAYDRARRELVLAAVGRLQASTGEAVEALTSVARKGRRDGDRVRAASAILDHTWRGLTQGDLLRDPEPPSGPLPADTTAVVRVLAERLRQLEATSLPASEKTRLTVTITDALLRALGVDVIEKRLAALEGVLDRR